MARKAAMESVRFSICRRAKALSGAPISGPSVVLSRMNWMAVVSRFQKYRLACRARETWAE